MEIKTIHSMKWATEDHSFVCLVADTDAGNNQEIGTPYSEASIIWAAVSAFPVDQIAAYVAPAEEADPVVE